PISREKFIPHPFETGKWLYRTGDQARWLPDGNIEFLGRMDHQVKIRGFRIEPGEIENRLTCHEGIKDAIVIARETAGGEKYLCAYYVTINEALPDSRARDYLSGYLPDYMVPAYFVKLDQIPLTPNGKVNRKALPVPDITSSSRYVAPRDDTEKQLVEIWSDLLEVEVDRIGIDDNFFQIGGHSLKAMTYLNRLHKTFDIQLPLSRFFTSPTIRAVAAFIKETRKSTYYAIEPAEEKEYYPLTNAQERFFLFQRLEPGDASYNMPEIMLLEGLMEKEKFHAAFKQMIRRHESLRTSFHMVEGEPVQKVHDHLEFEIEFPGRGDPLWSPLNGNHSGTHGGEPLQGFIRPFDLSRPPLLRSGLVKIEDHVHLFMVDMHHIITDGVSMGIFIKEFLALYSGKELPLPSLRYRDYVEWTRTRKKKEPKTALPAAEPGEDVLNLPYDYARPAAPRFEGSIVKFKLTEHETGTLKALVKRMDVSLYMFLLSVFNLFLSKVSGQENIVVGSPMAGRVHHNLEGLIGLFINTLVLRHSLPGQKTFITFLKEVKHNTLDTFENQDIQYERLLETITAARESGRNPLFDVMFVLQNLDLPKIEFPRLKVTREVGEQKASKFDMTLYVEEPEDIPVFKVEYNTQLFKEETILRFTRYFKTILASVLKDPNQTIAGIDCIPPSEKEQLLVRFNQTAVDYPKDATIYRLFEEQSERTPHAIVLRSRDKQLSYSQLNQRANRLARVLRARGVGANHVAGIMLNRSIELIETLFAVLKSGGTYLPIDPGLPGSRIVSMLESAEATVLLTRRELLEARQLEGVDHSFRVLLPGESVEEITRQSGENPDPLSRPDDLIYIIFTSGSTGVPKGAGVYHRSTVNLVNWFVTDFRLNPGDTGILLTSFSFDLTQKTIYGSCISGGVTVIPSTRYFDPQVILRDIWETRVTWTNCTPSMFAKLPEYCNGDELRQLERLRWVFLGGEPFLINPYLKWLRSPWCNGQIVNTYGPTECSDITGFFRIKEPRRFLRSPIPIGKPVYNTQFYILDSNRNILPIGTPGELCIGGDGVGIGYVNDKQLTSHKFITLPIAGKETRLYRTGDLAKWLPGGNAVYLGRLDHQVKIRGFRIELGEIEKQLLDHPDIKEALVTARKREDGDSDLCAYVIPVHGDGTSLTPGALKEYLIKELPDYMVPAYFVELDKMPLNPNGKVDRNSLPEPDASHGIEAQYVPPADPTEKQLVEIWSHLLDLEPDRIGVNDNFFQLGGHSLKAAGLIAAIHKELSVEIPIDQLFDTPTIRGIRQLIADTRDSDGNSVYASVPPTEKREYYPLSSAQKRLFVMHQLEPAAIAYNLPVALRLKGPLDRKRLSETFKASIKRHQSLRTSFRFIDGEPVQKVHDHVDFEIGFLRRGTPPWVPLPGNHCGVNNINPDVNNINPDGNNINGGIDDNNQGSHGGLPLQSFIRPFDLSIAPLLRIEVMEMEEDHHLLFFDMHHIISDGVSMGLFTKEFMLIYGGTPPPEPRLQYKDVSQWQNHRLFSSRLKEQEAFWVREFQEAPPVIHLPIDYPRPPVQDFSGHHLNVLFGHAETLGLKTLAAREKATLFMLLTALFNILLARISGQEDIVAGSPISGRRHADTQPIIGMFINTLPLRNFPTGETPFNQFLKEVKKNVLAAFENQEYPFEDLVDRVVKDRDLGRGPLFDVMLNMGNFHIPSLEIPHLEVAPYPVESGISKFDLTFGFEETGQDLALNIEYRTKLFKEQTVLRLAGYFKKIVSGVLNDSQIKINEIQLISEEERRQILVDFNDTHVEYPQDRTVHQLFEEQAGRIPHHIALTGPNSEAVTYGELNDKANRLAVRLRAEGTRPDSIVGIMMDRCLEMVISIFAILKAGGAYLPIAPGVPQERLDYMLKDSGARILLERHSVLGTGNISTFPPSNPSGLAYVIYTSGSTGKPKGVLVEHRALVNRLYWFQEHYRFNRDDVVLQTTPFTFDVSVCELFRWMQGESRLFLPPKDLEKEPRRLIDAMHRQRVTNAGFVPSVFNIFLEHCDREAVKRLAALKSIILIGEAVTPQLVKTFNQTIGAQGSARLINAYGPTEAVVEITSFDCTPGKYPDIIPIGRPMAN
ncbi:MAG: amino acid adenylation domain-containing protein, partial [bacterium]|nr:amino acid adenylation domain-containing protein [bacterium]